MTFSGPISATHIFLFWKICYHFHKQTYITIGNSLRVVPNRKKIYFSDSNMKPVKKALKITLAIICLCSLQLLSCSKSDTARRDPPVDPPESKTLAESLQHRWTFESLKVYRDSSCSGDSLAAIFGNPNDFMHFSPNGKLYSLLIASIDSADYILHPDSTLLINQYYNSIPATVPDTLSVRVLTNSQLILARRNEGGDWGKFTLKK